ncbi:MAG: cell division protein ZapD [Gammaproteobacteria bacterium]|nr:cell division protein ZapD [Gammaproteobacteria bacterium]
MLRLEHLFGLVNHHLEQSDVWSSRATINGLLDMVSIFAKAEIKADLIKELDRHREKLAKIRLSPGVDTHRLDQVLDELGQATSRLYGITGQIAQELRSNEFLKNILQRNSIPGGSCAFDLPLYHYWLEQHHEDRQEELSSWLKTLDPVQDAVILILSLIRGSTRPTKELASNGFFQRSLDPQTPAQLIQVGLSKDIRLFAEISGGKHRFTIRFMEPLEVERPTQTQEDIPFSLNTCIL